MFSLPAISLWIIGRPEALASVNITLQVVTSTTTLYSQNISVSPCPLSPSASTTLVTSAYCALEQAGLANDWNWFGNDAFLNSVNGIANNAGGNGVYWNWFGNLEYGQTSLSAHNLAAGENLLLAYGINPLRVSADNLTPTAGATSTILAEKFGFDSGFNPVWSPATTSIIYLNGNPAAADSTGHYAFLAYNLSSYHIHATETGYVQSNTLAITPTPAPVSPPTSGGSAWVPAPQKLGVERAVQFLLARQKSDGGYGGIYSDWVAIALGAYQKSNEALKKILLADVNPGDSLTDYERRAMALEALGVSPYDGTTVNYIGKIVGSFDGRQFGDPNLYNDDVFAIFPLLAAGYSADDPLILNSAKFIISRQASDGSWNEADMTAAAIQALTLVPQAEGSREVIQKAKDYLHKSQQSDGGFGSSFSTSWVIQAYNALGDLPQYWLKDKYPQDYLASRQQADGGLEPTSADINTRIWATAYAIPAVLDKPWSNILQKFLPPPATASSEINFSATSTPAKTDSTTVQSVPEKESSTPVANSAGLSKTNITTPILPKNPADEIISEVTFEQNTKNAAVEKQAAAVSLASLEPADNSSSSLPQKAFSAIRKFSGRIYANLLFIFSWF